MSDETDDSDESDDVDSELTELAGVESSSLLLSTVCSHAKNMHNDMIIMTIKNIKLNLFIFSPFIN